ncbi:hypothetical protein Cni_G25125 [Canna indica]|uniref:Uncharacterized protein n=1 Tax=Canna indica TaxID=4628 RepID=A0AAQ3KWI4_9LILI|nr:hypothetical protein Cni_G25125 [Canna indica]
MKKRTVRPSVAPDRGLRRGRSASHSGCHGWNEEGEVAPPRCNQVFAGKKERRRPLLLDSADARSMQSQRPDQIRRDGTTAYLKPLLLSRLVADCCGCYSQIVHCRGHQAASKYGRKEV